MVRVCIPHSFPECTFFHILCASELHTWLFCFFLLLNWQSHKIAVCRFIYSLSGDPSDYKICSAIAFWDICYLKGLTFGESSLAPSMLQSLTPSLVLCCISPRFSSICLSQPLFPLCCISDDKRSPAQGQLDTLHCIFSSLPLSLWLTSTSLSISALYFSCFAPSWFSVCHVFPALLFFSSLCLYWLPPALLSLYYISLSLPLLLFCLLASRALG